MTQIKPYQRCPFYYETDQMGIVHHSNYIRWFEEARLDWLEQIGLPFIEIEKAGLGVPVVAASCEYHGMVRFGDRIEIHLVMPLFTGTRMTVCYRVVDQDNGQLRASGETRHCFISENGRPVSLKKAGRPFYDMMIQQVAGE